MLGSALNKEECLEYEMHHLVKSVLLQDPKLSQLLHAQIDARYDEKLLQSLLEGAMSP